MSTSEKPLTRETMLREIETGWNELQEFLGSLTPEQLTEPTDPAGWTAKDHVIHLAAWENAGLKLLDGQNKRVTLNISPEVWEQDDDPINAVLQERYRDMPLEEVMKTLRETHERTMKKLESMTDAELQLPHQHYQPGSNQERPIINWLINDTVSHYRDHIPWIAEIAKKG